MKGLRAAHLNQQKALLVTGGWIEENGYGYEKSTEIYLPSTNKWTSGGKLPRGMKGLRAAHLNQQVVVTGGFGNDCTKRTHGGSSCSTRHFDEVLQYDVEAGKWTQINSLQKGRSSHGIAEVNLAALGCVGKTTGLDPLLALLICLFLLCWRGFNNSCTRQGENKQSL